LYIKTLAPAYKVKDQELLIFFTNTTTKERKKEEEPKPLHPEPNRAQARNRYTQQTSCFVVYTEHFFVRWSKI
jgi:hypothetical protein